jgi:uncharacterized protein DUF4158
LPAWILFRGQQVRRWLDGRAWLTGERRGLLVARAMEHLYIERVILPGPTTLARMVASARDQADRRGWAQLAAALTPEHRRMLEELVEVPEGGRETHLERLRHGPVAPIAAGLVAASSVSASFGPWPKDLVRCRCCRRRGCGRSPPTRGSKAPRRSRG